jgi:hypothetical protein
MKGLDCMIYRVFEVILQVFLDFMISHGLEVIV